MSYTIHNGDCVSVLAGMDENIIDTCITDPPYELGFMGKRWDSSGVAFQVATWEAVYRVLKPGALLLAFGGTRTYHRMVCAIEDAGFEIRDTIAWVYGSGFPKSYDISKGMDKYDATEARRNRDLRFTAWMRSTGLTASEINEITNSFMGSHYLTDKEQPAVATADMFDKLRPHVGYVPQWVEKIVEERTIESENFKNREVIGKSKQPRGKNVNVGYGSNTGYDILTAPSTPEAQLWNGWGTALKPAFEPIVIAQKPIDGTYAENALKWGVAGLWIDGGRVGYEGGGTHCNNRDENRKCLGHPDRTGTAFGLTYHADEGNGNQGRFPANLIHDGSDEVMDGFPQTGASKASYRGLEHSGRHGGLADLGGNIKDGTNTIRGHDDRGGSAARFFYCAKASRSERNAGLEGMEAQERVRQGLAGEHKNTLSQNAHPTVKPIELMRYLVRLTKTPTGGVVLDPFMGSGTTGIACLLEGREFIGIEREPDYADIAEKRIAYWSLQPRLEVK